MTKLFYIVVPYTSAIASDVANSLPFLKKGSAAQQAPSGTDSFEEHRAQLEQRMALVVGGLANAGVRAVPLGTEEIIELLYRSFNVGEMENPIRLTN